MMNVTTHDRAGVRFLECLDPITRVDDALALISAGVEQDMQPLLLDASVLPPEFFELSTRFAGEFIQKLQNYRVRLALVLPEAPEHSARFREFVAEARSGRSFRTFANRADAEAWLTAS
jgi:hypothetical protein